MKLRAVYWLAAAFAINFFAVGSFILGEYYTRLCGISFPYAASNPSELAILAQRGGAQALLSRAPLVK